MLSIKKGKGILPHPLARLNQVEPSELKLLDTLFPGAVATIKGNVVNPFVVAIEEFLKDGGTRERLHNFPDDVLRLSKTDFNRVLSRLPFVSLFRNGFSVKGINSPGSNAQLDETGHRLLIIASDNADLNGIP